MLRVYNTLTKKKEKFIPLENKKVKMFVCGQTVYDDAHLGHAKTYIQFDIIVRWLRYLGYKVTYVQNITDVDDKIINRAKEKGIDPMQLASYYIKRFFEDMEKIGVKQNVDMFPKSSEYIKEIIEQVKVLIEKGYAYVVDGDVYYDVSKFKDYTKLSGISLEELKHHRIEPDPRKKNPYDFSLWKSQPKNELGWPSPWGWGRPGWHIEDTAMTVTIFGPQYDIHGGATELIFPHHTNEIAQAEAATGVKPFVKYWLHSGVLNIKGEKMSKSLKNFVTIREALKKWDPEVLRMYYASAHYRSPMEYSEEGLKQAKERLDSLYITLENLLSSVKGEKETNDERNFLETNMKNFKQNFVEAMNDDFNTPLALAHMFRFASEVNVFIQKRKVSKRFTNEILKVFKEFGNIFGILQKEIELKLPEEARKLIEEREKLRKEGKFEDADKIREMLREKFGILLEDTPTGVKWRKAK